MREQILRKSTEGLPVFYLIPAIVCLIYNTAIYLGTQNITEQWHHWNLTGTLDKRIPVIPEFTGIYLLFFLFWTGNFLLAGFMGKSTAYRLIAADLLAWTVCGIIFLLFPTTNERPEVVVTDIWSWLMKLIYRIDPPANLFPSIHCLASWLSFVMVRSQKRLPVWYRWSCLVLAAAICFSTVAVRQHVLADVAAGILLAEASYYLAGIGNWAQKLADLFEKLTIKKKTCER